MFFLSGFSFESVKNDRFTGEWGRCDANKLKPQTHKTREWYHSALTMSVLLSHIFLSVVRCASTLHAQLEHFFYDWNTQKGKEYFCSRTIPFPIQYTHLIQIEFYILPKLTPSSTYHLLLLLGL